MRQKLCVGVFILCAAVQLRAQIPVRVFLEPPAVPALVDDVTKDTQSLYTQLRNRLQDNKRVTLTDSRDDAQIVLTAVSRQAVDTGADTTTSVHLGRGIVRSSTENAPKAKEATVELQARGQTKILRAQTTQTFFVEKDLSRILVHQIEKVIKDNF
jgi:hypothetical protein